MTGERYQDNITREQVNAVLMRYHLGAEEAGHKERKNDEVYHLHGSRRADQRGG